MLNSCSLSTCPLGGGPRPLHFRRRTASDAQGRLRIANMGGQQVNVQNESGFYARILQTQPADLRRVFAGCGWKP